MPIMLNEGAQTAKGAALSLAFFQRD